MEEGLSVGVWASVGATISSIEEIVAPSGGAVSQEGAEATRPVEPEEEAEAEASR